jgi:hypothetical protein
VGSGLHPPGELVLASSWPSDTQAFLYRAFGEQRRVQFAKDALEVGPDCADAYVLLPEHTTSR